MLFVGHISLAFLIVYFLSTRFQGIQRTVSIALVMVLSILPDIDIIFRLAGIDLGHRTITHSIIIWLVIGGISISYFKLNYHKGLEAAVYLIAYLSHLMIGDILVGPINILFPIGEYIVKSPIQGVRYFLLETLVFSLMATVVITNYYLYRKKDKDIFLFRYRSKIDALLYPVLIVALITSCIYALTEFELNLLEASIVAPLHIAAVCVIVLMWRVSKSTETQRLLASPT
ncbi:MAG TPA: metal-dependent hydrolase [Nitrososphaeraceae archaeon]|nr:metal-dependent hydrolase [Nitrososphaeraceae archaeon]